jgi:hypothetical protein
VAESPPKKRRRFKRKPVATEPPPAPAKKRAAPKKKRAPAKKKKRAAPKRKRAPRAGLKRDLPKTHVIRQQAHADYVTDPESRDEGFHYIRDDREYAKHVNIHIFRKWKEEDEWDLHRAAYWAEAQKMLLEKTRDQTVQMLADSMNQLNELRNFAFEWCDPIRDEATGEVLRYPDTDDKGRPHRFAGKPMLAVPIRNFEVAVTSALALDEAVRDRRDEVLRLTGQGDSASKAPTDPVVAQVNLTPADLRSMAAALVERRQPELVDDALDIRPEDHRPPDEE